MHNDVASLWQGTSHTDSWVRLNTLSFLACLVILAAIYMSTLIVPYASHDQYRHFTEPRGNLAFKQSCSNEPYHSLQMKLGRPIAAVGECVVFENASNLSDLNTLRFAALILLALAAASFAAVLRNCGLGGIASVSLSLAIFTLPPMHAGVFMTSFAFGVAPLTASLSHIALQRAHDKYSQGSRGAAMASVLLAGALLVASLLTYPFLTLFFLCATMARLLFAPASTWRHQALLLVRDGLFFGLAAALYWCIAKVALFPHDAASVAPAYRSTLSFSGAVAKLGSFSTDVLGRVLALWFLYPSLVLSGAIELVVGIGLLLYLWRASKEADPPPFATRVVTAVGILALLVAVNSLYLLTPAIFLYRIFFAFAASIVLLVYWGSAQIGVHSGISNLPGVRNGPWAAIAICGVACSVTCITTTRNVLNSYLEFAFVKAQIAASPDRGTLQRIHVVQPRSSEFGFTGYPAETDEFNRPTTNFYFDIPSLVRQALVEMNAQPKYILYGQDWVERTNRRACRIERIKPGNLRIFKEDKSSAEASIQGNRIQSPDARFNGTVAPDLKVIRWSDGSIWGRSEKLDPQKSAPESTGDMDAALAGPWVSLDGYGADEMLVTWSEPGASVIRSPKMLVVDMNALLDSALGWPDPPGIPKPVSVSPSKGNTATARFQAIVTIPEGFANIASIELLFHAPGSMATYCDVKYDRVGNQFWIVNDAGNWAGPSRFGTGTPLSNAQCSLNVAAAAAQGGGNPPTLTFPVTFTTSYSGAKEVYMSAVSTTGQYSGYQIKGTWTVPGN